MGTANAVNTGPVLVTCTNGTHGTGWDNSNQYFEGKGNIAALYCDIIHHTGYVSDNLSDPSLRWYQGVILVDTPTAIVETHTVQVPPSQETSTSPSLPQETETPVSAPESPSPVETPTSGGQHQSDDQSSAVVETSTAPSQPVESSTPSSENPQDTATPVLSETQTSTSESSTQTIPVETGTPVVETPLPTPPPVVEPQPVPVPAPAPPAPQPEPQPQPVPEPAPEPIPEAPPLAEPAPEEKPVAEEPPPVAEPSAPPVVEEKNETPVEPSPEVQPELTPEPLPQPVAEPAPVIQPDIAYTPPSNDGATVTLDNGVVITEEEAAAIVLLSNPAELISELFSDPGAVFSALGSVGADMSPEVREQSEKVVLASVIAGNIATQAAATAGAVAAYRRKP